MGLINTTSLAGIVTIAALSGCAATSSQSVSWQTSDLHTVSVMMSEPMMKVDDVYHELLDSYYVKPMMTENKVVMSPLDDMIDELNGIMTFDGNTVTYKLNDKTVVMSLGSVNAIVNGEQTTAPESPFMFDDALYVPFRFVFEGLGGKYTWNASRELAEVSLLRPTGSMFKPSNGDISLKTIFKQEDGWYTTEQAASVFEAILANQNPDGGWFKIGSSHDLSVIYDREAFATYRQKSTIDNDATAAQIQVLANAYVHTGDVRYKDSALKGIQYLLDGQYENGGWPQFFPITTSYHRHVTFNDDAISNVLTVLRDVANKTGSFSFVSDSMAQAAQESVDAGIAFIIENQVEVNGIKTGWCAQYHFQTLECAQGRSYELASISGDESVKVIKFLMTIENPSQDIINAINRSVAFLASQTIEGKKLVKFKDTSLEFGNDRVVIDEEGSAVWPRFINLETLAPLYSNRQGDQLTEYKDISYERRVKYSWLVTSPGKLFKNEYPTWQKKYSPNINVLN